MICTFYSLNSIFKSATFNDVGNLISVLISAYTKYDTLLSTLNVIFDWSKAVDSINEIQNQPS